LSEERKASRRDLFRLIGRSLAEFAEESRPAEAIRAASDALGGPKRRQRMPATKVPVEEGHLVIDLGMQPVPINRGRRFQGIDTDLFILVVRVTPEHFAAVTADCPHCGGALKFDVPSDAVRCPDGAIAFRMDGQQSEGPGEMRLVSYACRSAGPRVEVDLPPETDEQGTGV
jgi:nitrite reductase/ring-hydroxylating ferredoxin subunit